MSKVNLISPQEIDLLKTIGLVLFAVLLFVLGVYFWNFHDGFSNNQMHWGAFGGFVSGTFGSVLTVTSIGMVVYFNLNQYKKMKAQEELKHLESRAEYTLDLITKEVFKIRSSLPISDILIKGFGWSKDGATVSSVGDEYIRLANNQTNEARMFPCGNPIEIFSQYSITFGEEKAKYEFFQMNAGNWIKDFKNFDHLTRQLTLITIKMINSGYSIELAQSMLAIPFNYAELLHSVDEFDKTTFQQMTIIQSTPSIDLNSVKLDTFGRLMTSLKQNGHGSYSLNEFDTTIDNSGTGAIPTYVFIHKSNKNQFSFNKNHGWKVKPPEVVADANQAD